LGVILVSFLISAIGVYRHRSNIDRLIKGSENRIAQ
jgi:glycerol-3-phosphate acyltransferase PlsY